ncbi:MAG: hypothetical protein ACTSYS_07750 [Promethearchaeota archaeon]
MSSKLTLKSSTGASSSTVYPEFFTARMTRDAPIGALIAIITGFVLLIVKQMFFPDLDLNGMVATALTSTGSSAATYISAILSIPTVNDPLTPLSIIKYLYASFISFPSNSAWFIAGFIVSYMRIRSGRDEGNLKGGWDAYWYGLVSVEIPFAVFGVIFLFSTLNPALIDLQGFTGSVLLFFLLFFLQPMFWLGLIICLLGSIVGAKVARK